ncbi:hypothetical protein CL619_00520 [archaeon]|nr:hypothetical protein [archaeon]|tara:strand:+ start:3034 stop:3783 length:750 start_codon:yes stop_codon:yes gene_type:complete
MDIETQLEQIGLNKSEIKVYLALLELGSSSTGPIITKSHTANSKIYEVLERLIQKGLVSHFTKMGVKYYKAASPKMILEFLKDKKKTIENQELEINKILPTLLKIQEEKEEEKESLIFSGPRGIKTAFTNLVDELKQGDEVHIMGVHDFGKQFLPLALHFQKIRSHKKIKAKFLINISAKNIAKKFKNYPPVEIRFMPEKLFTPAIFIIYKDKVIINLAKEMTFFVIKSKSAKDAFEAYFQLMWKTANS